MCELLGISTSEPTDVRVILRSFYRHSVDHPHGWGLMREYRGKREITREAVCAARSAVLPEIIADTPPQKTMLAHIRYATIGGMERVNCHPFTGADISGREWTLIHNGTIYSGIELAKYLTRQTGDTDSERILLYLLDEINARIRKKGAPLTAEERCQFVEHAAAALAPRNKLNFMLYDGEQLYVHKNMRSTLSCKALDSGVLFATSPVNEGGWKPLPMNRVLVYRGGRRVYEGRSHGHEFISSLGSITEFDAMNI